MTFKSENEAFAIAARRMRDNGITIADIAAALGFSKTAVHRWVNEETAEKDRERERLRGLKANPNAMTRKEARERRARMADMRRAGASAAETAEAFGVSIATVQLATREAGVKAPRAAKKSGRDAEILRMRKDGRTQAEIAEALGVSRQRVGFILARAAKATFSRPHADNPALVSKQARQAAAIRAKWLAFAQQNA